MGAGCVLPPAPVLDCWPPTPSRLGAGRVGLSGLRRGGEGRRPEGRGSAPRVADRSGGDGVGGGEVRTE